MDSLIALCNHGAYGKEHSALCRPVAGTAASVFLSSNYNKRCRYTLSSIFHRSIIYAHLFTGWNIHSPSTLSTGKHQVLQSNISKRATNHDLVIAATRAIAVEIARLNPFLDQISPSRTIRCDITCRRDVVSCHRVSKKSKYTRALYVPQRLR